MELTLLIILSIIILPAAYYLFKLFACSIIVSDDELMEVCKDFESYFLEQMLKSMVKMTKVDGDTDDSNLYSSLFGMTDNSDSGMSTLSSYFGDEIVQQVADKSLLFILSSSELPVPDAYVPLV